MSEVYIRSQNREKLYQFAGRFSGLEYRKVTEADGTLRHAIFLTGGMETGGIPGISAVAEDIEVRMGGYDTKERCLKILDEIERICDGYLCAPGSSGMIRGTTATPHVDVVIPRVYQMPEK